MSSLLTVSQKTQAETLLDNLHETFRQAVFYYLERDILTLSATANYNYIYGTEQQGVTKTTEIISGSLQARIYYPDFIASKNFKNYSQENLPIDSKKTQARLKIDVADYELFSKAKQIVLPDGQTYQVVSAPKPISMFSGVSYMSVMLESVK